jgi:hypothetical protein
MLMEMTQSDFGICIVQYFDGVRQGKFVKQEFSFEKWPKKTVKSRFYWDKSSRQTFPSGVVKKFIG